MHGVVSKVDPILMIIEKCQINHSDSSENKLLKITQKSSLQIKLNRNSQFHTMPNLNQYFIILTLSSGEMVAFTQCLVMEKLYSGK